LECRFDPGLGYL